MSSKLWLLGYEVQTESFLISITSSNESKHFSVEKLMRLQKMLRSFTSIKLLKDTSQITSGQWVKNRVNCWENNHFRGSVTLKKNKWLKFFSLVIKCSRTLGNHILRNISSQLKHSPCFCSCLVGNTHLMMERSGHPNTITKLAEHVKLIPSKSKQVLWKYLFV